MSSSNIRRQAMLLALLSVTMCTAFARQSAEPPSAPAKRQYPTAALFETTSFTLPASTALAFDFNNTHLLVSSDEAGVSNVYSLDLRNGQRKPLTHSTTQAMDGISWFPHDDRFLYSSDRQGNEQYHLFVGRQGRPAIDLTPGKNVRAFFVGWSQDGQSLFIASNERDPQAFDLYRYDSKDYRSTRVFLNQTALELATVNRSGRYVAALTHRGASSSEIFLIDLGNKGELIPVAADEPEAEHAVLGFSPDGMQLNYVSNAHGEFQQAYAYDIASRRSTTLIADKWDVLSVLFSRSGRYRATMVNDDALTVARIFDRRENRDLPLPATLAQSNISAIHFSSDEKQLALLLESTGSPADVYLYDLGSGSVRRLTQALSAAVDAASLVEAQAVRYPSFDGLQIPAILYMPPGASKRAPIPAVVFVHGGPGDQTRRVYSPEFQHLANYGYALLSVNNRGSAGYGKTFSQLDDRHHGEGDLQDVLYARRYLKTLDGVDPHRIAVMGRSYGGFLTLAALASGADTFDAGIDIFGVTDWERTLKDIPPWWNAIREHLYAEIGDPVKDVQRLRSISPFFHPERIKKPVLVVQGANDPRVPLAQTAAFIAAMRSAGTAVEYLEFADEGHGFRKRSNRIIAADAYLSFLNKHLIGP